MPYLLDTGILLRLVNRDDPEHAAVINAVYSLKAGNESLLTATQNIAEFWNVCTRPPSARGGFGLPVEATGRFVGVFERLFRPILPETSSSYLEWKQLVTTHQVKGAQVHDARLVALMKAYGLTHLLTLNDGDFRRYCDEIHVEHPRNIPLPG